MKRIKKTVTGQTRIPNGSPVDPKIGQTLYLFDDADGVVSAVVRSVDGDRVELSAPGVGYFIDRRSLFATFADCAAANGIETRKRGRPRLSNSRPQRTLGRVNDADWKTLQDGARIAGQTFTDFALPTLLAKARRLIAKGRP